MTTGAQMSFRTRSFDWSYKGSILSFGVGNFTRDSNIDFVFGGPLTPFKNERISFQAITASGDGMVSSLQKIFKTTPKAIHPREMFVGDLNGDGVDDLFSANHGYDAPPYAGERDTLALSSGGRLIDRSSTLPSSAFTHSVSGGDIDNDGDIDLLAGVTGWTETGPYFLINDGRGNFTQNDAVLPKRIGDGHTDAAYNFTTSHLTDINNDGFIDLVVGFAEDSPYSGATYLNDGKGAFLEPSEVFLPAGRFGANKTVGTDILSLDINRDGFNDLIIAQTASEPYYQGQKIQILINDQSGHFRDETTARIAQNGKGTWNQTIQAVDFDNDGDMDLLAQSDHGMPTEQTVLWLNKNGKFQPAPASLLADFQGTIVQADINHDGRMDYLSFLQSGGHYGQGGNGTWKIKTHINTSKNSAYLYGDSGKDKLIGSAGNNKLLGDLGNDDLTGKAGKDTFVFNTALSPRFNVDRITDFKVADDSIWLDNAIFREIGRGTPAKPVLLQSGMFWKGAQAQDEGDRIIYDPQTGALYYDPDGTGDQGQMRFATLSRNLKVTDKDFFVI
jgi:Ca2+-binding RTX toxin-like protein